jgi:hypothetical protein
MALKALMTAPWIDSLRQLELTADTWNGMPCHIGAAELRALASCGSFPNLRKLRLEGLGLGDEEVGVLA